jgi:hypothetical protein
MNSGSTEMTALTCATFAAMQKTARINVATPIPATAPVAVIPRHQIDNTRHGAIRLALIARPQKAGSAVDAGTN